MEIIPKPVVVGVSVVVVVRVRIGVGVDVGIGAVLITVAVIRRVSREGIIGIVRTVTPFPDVFFSAVSHSDPKIIPTCHGTDLLELFLAVNTHQVTSPLYAVVLS